ncbi:hypothetical protein [Streptomyces sp. NPDC056480]
MDLHRLAQPGHLLPLRENDEALIRLAGAAAHDAYKANFLAMRAEAVLQ